MSDCKLTKLLGRPPENVCECLEGIRDAENDEDERIGMGKDYKECYDKTKSGIKEI